MSVIRGVGMALVALALAQPLQAQRPRTLDVYFIDVEGGQATLIVTPSRETLLVDAGFPGTGTFRSRPADSRQSRDPMRIVAAAADAGVTKIDYLLVTHFHADHMGGVPELAQLLPIGTFIDHDDVLPVAETTVSGTLAVFQEYAAVRAKGKHLAPAPGDRLPIRGIDAMVVSARGEAVVRTPWTRPGQETACPGPNVPATTQILPAQEPNENPRSTGIILEFGKFRFLDVGDLTGKPFVDLICPGNRLPPVDVYLVSHHGGADAAIPETFAAWQPRAAIFNNGPTKGGAAETLAVARNAKAVGDVWQLHRSMIQGAVNFPDAQIANLDDTTAHWIKLQAMEDGSFTITNGRTGVTKRYPAR